MNLDYDAFSNSVLSAMVDDHFPAQTEFTPQLVLNSEDEQVKTHIEQELRTCSGFTFAVAFISNAVLTDLKVQFADLATKNIHGRILTSTYLGFNQPKVFQELLKIPNLEVRVLDQNADFHAKGYIFNKSDYQTTIIGSSNLTSNALIKNYEWNIKFSSLENGALTTKINQQIEAEWQTAHPLTSDWIDQYSEYYQSISSLKPKNVPVFQAEAKTNLKSLQPNKMQKDALQALQSLRQSGQKKGLVVSATGTGKTYLGAFDVQNFAPQKFLFVVHREQILNKAIKSFQKILGGPQSDYGVLSGNIKETNRKYLFATIQTLSQEKTLSQFDPQAFDYILVDEAHKTGAKSYRSVINYFQPQFMLGMTATPERTDDFNIYELFDYNIAYEIRLQDAIKENMLSQFHYIGITDYEFNGEPVINDQTPLKHLVSEERMQYVEQQLDYYGHDGDQIYGLIFCSRKDEAREIAKIMSAKGHPSTALTGDNSIQQREKVINEFEHGKLDYIVTVDIFNEGIDIPKVNQVIMLRNTESSIIFIQQLGRGLRKYPNKEFVTIIDFIGNYQNNYLIPIALTGDQSMNKNNLRSHVLIDQTIGLSSINFSEIARERIYNSINSSNLTLLSKLRDSYINLKNRLGRRPLLGDFQKIGSLDAQVLIDKYGNYHQFLLKMHDALNLSELEDHFLRLVSREFSNGMRIHELVLLKQLLERSSPYPQSDYLNELRSLHTYTDPTTISSVESHLNLSYFQPNDQKKYGSLPYVTVKNHSYMLDSRIVDMYHKNSYFRSLVDDALNIGFLNSQKYLSNQKFTINKKYTRRNVNSLLGWPTDQSSAIYGYKEKMGFCPMFVTYQKRVDIPDELNHNNIFFNSTTLSWYTKSPRRLDSNEVVRLFDGNKNDTIDLMLFVKKNDDEGSDFYYLGQVDFDFDSIEQQFRTIKGKEKPIVKANLNLRAPVDYNLFLNLTN